MSRPIIDRPDYAHRQPPARYCGCDQCRAKARENNWRSRRKRGIGPIFTIPMRPLLDYLADSGAPAPYEPGVTATHRAWHRAVVAGRCTDRAAERFASRLGVHPCEIWTDWFDLTTERSAS